MPYKPTKLQALRHSKIIWQWLAVTGLTKNDFCYSRDIRLSKDQQVARKAASSSLFNCPLCEYTEAFRPESYLLSCEEFCPVGETLNCTCPTSLFQRWCIAPSKETAKPIYEIIKAAYNRELKNPTE